MVQNTHSLVATWWCIEVALKVILQVTTRLLKTILYFSIFWQLFIWLFSKDPRD